MPRKTIDCRSMPSDRNCSVAISGDEDEVLRLAVAHSVATHGHTDDADLRDALRAVMRDEGDLPLAEGAFLQLIEFHTGHPERFQALAEEWRERIGTDATAQWAVVAADRDRRGHLPRTGRLPGLRGGHAQLRAPGHQRLREEAAGGHRRRGGVPQPRRPDADAHVRSGGRADRVGRAPPIGGRVEG